MKSLLTIATVAFIALTLHACKEEIIEPPMVLDEISCDSIPKGAEGTNLRMVWVDPNPLGDDNFSEKITFMNFAKGGDRINTAGYYFENSWSRRFDLPGRWIEPCAMSEFVIDEVELFENDGDTLYLYAAAGDKLIQTFVYPKTTEGVKLRVR